VAFHEIDVIADDLVVIGNGRIVARGAKDDLTLAGCRSHAPSESAAP
jgi:ABC-2 type transport system ATP-binding protein